MDSSEANELDLELRRLECEKLRAEILQAELAWWKRPGYIGSIAPILIALIGFLSVWSTGFFETQRAKLKNEIELLETEQKELSDNNQRLVQSSAEIQKQIDQAYLSFKLAIADASYAFGHLRGTGPPLSRADHERVRMVIKEIPEDASQLVLELLSKEQIMNDIVPITEKELQRLGKVLQFIPASEWATELETSAESIHSPVLRAPDGGFYNLADGKFYEKFEDIENQ